MSAANKVYHDLGEREQWGQLLADCQIDPPARLLLRSLDELGDTPAEVSDRLAQIEALGIDVLATEQPYRSAQLNAASPTEMRAQLASLLQEVQQHQQRRLLRQGHARNRLNFLPPPGKAPYGYRRGKDRYVIDRSTAPVVKDFFEHFLLYGSLRGAVRYLEKRYGKKIAVSTGRRWLTNPVYRGNLVYRNGDVIADTHAPILPKDEAAQVDRLLRRNSRLPTRTASAPRSLAGLVVCQKCQTRMKITRVTARGKPKEYLYLRPIHCPRQRRCQAIPYSEVLQQTIKKICQELPRSVARLDIGKVGKAKEQILAQIEQKRAASEQLSELIAQGILDPETATLRRYKLRTEMAQLQSQSAQLPPENLRAIAQTVSFPQFWLDLSEAERRFYFREFIRQIAIVRTDTDWHLALVFIF
ncbi:MAG: recombinase family protein [Cyanophyceae cyanobacterium]